MHFLQRTFIARHQSHCGAGARERASHGLADSSRRARYGSDLAGQ
jgi:hypothetical protein